MFEEKDLAYSLCLLKDFWDLKMSKLTKLFYIEGPYMNLKHLS